jgi:phage protein U
VSQDRGIVPDKLGGAIRLAGLGFRADGREPAMTISGKAKNLGYFT